MSDPKCMVCRTISASTFCFIHAAFLCPPCDTAIHLPSKPSCPDQHRISLPLHSITALTPSLPTTSKSTTYNPHSSNKTPSIDTVLDDSDLSSDHVVFPDNHQFATFSLPNHVPPPSCQQDSHTANVISPGHVSTPPRHHTTPFRDSTAPEHLTSIADAFIQKEAQHLYESSAAHAFHPHFVDPLHFPVMVPLAASFTAQPPPSTHHTAYKHSSPSKQSQHFHNSSNKALKLDPGRDFSFTAHGAVSSSSLSPLHEQSSTMTTDDKGDVSQHHSLRVVEADVSLFENFKLKRIEEQKRRNRHAALVRFRAKKANRSFRKKVRYECRKQLADSRPRVKGRFVGRSRRGETGAIRKQTSPKG